MLTSLSITQHPYAGALKGGQQLSEAADTVLWILVVTSCILLVFFCVAALAGAIPLFWPKETGRFATCRKSIRCIMHPLGFVVLAIIWICVGLGFSFGGSRLQRRLEYDLVNEMPNFLPLVPLLLVFTGDYCQDPNENLISVPALEGEEQYLKFYSTCQGETDITTSLELAKGASITIAQDIIEPILDFFYEYEILLESCPSKNIIELGEQAALTVIGSYVLLVLTSAISSCSAVNPIYGAVVYGSGK